MVWNNLVISSKYRKQRFHMIFSPEFVLDERYMEWKTGSKACFGEKLHKSMALSLEPNPHKYWEMGMNVGGVNQEGDHLGVGGSPCWRGDSTSGAAERGVNWVGGQKLAPQLWKRSKKIKGKSLKPSKGSDIKGRLNIKPRNKRPPTSLLPKHWTPPPTLSHQSKPLL